MFIEINNFEEFEKYTASGTALVDFNATWCGPCRMLAPILHQLDKEPGFEDLKVLSVDVDKVPAAAARYGIQLIPTLFLFKDGARVKTTQGYQTLDALKNFVTK